MNIDVKQNDFKFSNEIAICNIQDKQKVSELIYSIFSDACIAYFGIYDTNIQDVVLHKAIERIYKDYSNISLKEIQHSFERIELQRQITITVDDLINPIKKYLHVKYHITMEEKKYIKELEENELRIIKTKEFEESSLKCYRLCLPKNEWKGNIFNAHAIAKIYLADKFTKEEKIDMFQRAKEQRVNLEKLLDSDHLKICEFVGHTEERLFSNMIVIEAINRQIEI